MSVLEQNRHKRKFAIQQEAAMKHEFEEDKLKEKKKLEPERLYVTPRPMNCFSFDGTALDIVDIVLS